jgi:hypothetical protein
MRGLYPRTQTPHPSAMLRIASTLSHKGRGEEKPGDDELKTAVSASTNQFQE